MGTVGIFQFSFYGCLEKMWQLQNSAAGLYFVLIVLVSGTSVLGDPVLHFVGQTPSDQLVSCLVDMLLSDQIVIGLTTVVVTSQEEKHLEIYQFPRVGRICVDLLYFILFDRLYFAFTDRYEIAHK